MSFTQIQEHVIFAAESGRFVLPLPEEEIRFMFDDI